MLTNPRFRIPRCWCKPAIPAVPQPASSSCAKSKHSLRGDSRPRLSSRAKLDAHLPSARCCCENPDDMKLQINGEARDFDSPLTLAGLVDQLGMKADRVAIELNCSIVARDRWPETNLAEGDRLEIVHFVGGG